MYVLTALSLHCGRKCAIAKRTTAKLNRVGCTRLRAHNPLVSIWNHSDAVGLKCSCLHLWSHTVKWSAYGCTVAVSMIVCAACVCLVCGWICELTRAGIHKSTQLHFSHEIFKHSTVLFPLNRAVLLSPSLSLHVFVLCSSSLIQSLHHFIFT